MSLIIELSESKVVDFDSKEANELFSRYSKFMESIFAQSLQNAHELRPILDGKAVATLLGIKPGPRVGVLLQELIEWQLSKVDPTPEEAKLHIQRFYENI